MSIYDAAMKYKASGTPLIILAGILTLLGSTDRAVSVLADLPFVEEASRGLSELKLLCLAVVFVYAFFTFSWCMRQYNFAAILVGSAPMIGERNVGELERKSFAERAARVAAARYGAPFSTTREARAKAPIIRPFHAVMTLSSRCGRGRALRAS